MLACRQVGMLAFPSWGHPMTFGESLVFLVALLSGILDSIGAAGAAGAAGHGDNLGTSSIGISALNQYKLLIDPTAGSFFFLFSLWSFD